MSGYFRAWVASKAYSWMFYTSYQSLYAIIKLTYCFIIFYRFNLHYVNYKIKK